MLHKRIITILFLIFLTINLSAQENLLQPVFPASSTGLVYIEGEDAVSTNFANQPVSNFGCSGYQSVQLNRATSLQGGASFYAEFVFYIEEPGEYEFWYGGTPPGPADDLSPSYASPFRFSLDGGEQTAVYREDIHVVEGYTPSYYWNKCSLLTLTEGTHRLRIEVSEKRAYDGRYYFYLDSLFFLNKEKIAEIDAVKPAVFPSGFDDLTIDNPFLSINDYENYIKLHPDEMAAYIELSLVYSLLGDYVGALKTLTRAMALDSSDPYPVVLAAKNRLWKGDIRESLDLYQRALSIDPGNKLLWAEAGKVAAWTAEYDRAIAFFMSGLEKFPDDMNMRVNLGLTYLWMSRSEDAENTFDTALRKASGDPEKLAELGWIEEANGYPDYAKDVYKQSIELFPSYLEFYLLLQASYLATGDRGAADEVGKQIESTFRSSNRLQNELEIYQKKLNLRDEVIESYLAQLKDDPGNLELRQELAQTFFWNGMRIEAIEQIKYVITTHSFRAAETFGRRNADLLAMADKAAAVIPFFDGYPLAADAAVKNIISGANELKRTQKAVDAAAAGDNPDTAAVAAARTGLRKAEQAWADAVAAAQYLIELMDETLVSLNEYENTVKAVLVDEKAEDEAFSAVVSSSGWSWNRDWQISELSGIMEQEQELASFMLGRVLTAEQRYKRAAEVLLPVAAGGEAAVQGDGQGDVTDEASGGEVILDYSGMTIDRLYALYEAILFGGGSPDFGTASQRLFAEYPHLQQVSAELDLAENLALGKFEAAAGVYFDGLSEDSADAVKQLGDYRKTAADQQKKAERIFNQLTAVISKELERANYYLEADTFLIRYELGNYYLDEGLNQKASEQFRRVIAIDPWNISATYKLGIVEQRYGHWSDAMKFYKKVYQQDSSYENVVYYYNQLARAHADNFTGSMQLTNSPSEIALTGTFKYNTEFNSFIGLGINYTLDQQRRYYANDGQQKSSFQVHLLEAFLPFTFNVIGLSVTPHAGVYAESLYYKDDDFIFYDSVTMVEFLKELSTFPKFGISARWSKAFLTLDLSWDNSIEADTFYIYPDFESEKDMRYPNVRKNDIALNAATWFNLDDFDFLGPLTTRTYGRLQLMDDGNTKWQVFQDAMMGFNLLSNPVIRISPFISVNYEDTVVDPDVEYVYYAPQNVLEAKGGLRSAFTFPSADWSSAFEAVLWAAGGGYWSSLGDAASVEANAKVEGGLGATWVKNSNMYYLNLNSAGTFDETGNTYWELSVVLGTNLKLPGLLTQ